MALCEESKAWETDAAVAFRNPERKELILLDCENIVILEIGRGVLRPVPSRSIHSQGVPLV